MTKRASQNADVRALSVPALIARIVDRHHAYLRTALPFLAQLSAKVAHAHGERAPNLVELHTTFLKLKELLEPHLDTEERELFPDLMAQGPVAEDKLRAGRQSMRAEHHVIGRLLRRLRELGGDFLMPDWGCSTYELLVTELDKLEKDLTAHIRLENDVLLPRFAQRRRAGGQV